MPLCAGGMMGVLGWCKEGLLVLEFHPLAGGVSYGADL